ncbi:methyltransferase domain-containing protein [Candidatus Parcubacteria bacterium]|nr:methyltransferase domain-containing protein [Candidatus Parcubacteria bacterium]
MSNTTFLARWYKEFVLRRAYTTAKREPFFTLAGKFLPVQRNATVIDIGAADGAFAHFLNLKERYPKLILLDQNPTNVSALRLSFKYVERYHAPDRIPCEDNSVQFIHLSHIVEHLSFQELYVFLKECDRVLASAGILVISTPLLWDRFYDDLSHVKPYNPEVFLHYLTRAKHDASAEAVSNSYVNRALVYRYRVIQGSEWGSKFFVIDCLIRCWRLVLSFLGFRRYVKNGYTLILEKNLSN